MMRRMRALDDRLVRVSTVATYVLVAACGGSSPAGPAVVHDAGLDATGAADAADGAAAADAADASDAAANAQDAAQDAAGEAAAPTPITGLSSDAWTWVPFPNAHCRDGSTTGIGVNVHAGSNKLMLFLQGGGACFNLLTCLNTPAAFGEADFTALAATTDGGVGAGGVFDRSDAANPVKDWNYVYVPYCTGDVHSGDQPNGMVSGVSGTQAFVGYTNIGAYLERIVPTFPGLTQVLLTGVSAGGFGAAANYVRVARAFGSVPVTLVDDSGPFMDTPYVATCLSQAWVQTWGLDKTLLADCGSDCANDGHFLLRYVKHVLTTYPSSVVGLVDSTDDNTITQFFGFGDSNCTGYVQLTGATFTAGLQDIRTQLAGQPNFGAYVFSGTRHTTLESTTDLNAQEAPGADGGSVLLTDWIGQILAGRASNVGP
jgi:hypothetical protein